MPVARAATFILFLVAAPTAVPAQGLTPAPAPDQTDASDHGRAASHDGNAPPVVEQKEKQAPAIKLSALYTTEVWRNVDGGIRPGWRYLDNLDLTLTVDAERALGWRGITLFVYGLYNNGHAFSGDLVGDAQIVSNIETGVRAARLYEAWVEQRFAGDRVSLKFGLYDLNSEFDTTDVGSLSLLSSHGIGPEFGQSGRNGPSIFPVTSLALRGEGKFGQHWVARAAVLDGVPGDPDHPARTAVKLSGHDGALLVGEMSYVGTATKATVGYWRYTAAFALLDDESRRAHGNDGAYVVVEHRLLRAGAPKGDVKPGLAAFAQFGLADARYNRIRQYAGGGLVYTGLLRAEQDDRVGVTIARAWFGTSFRRSIVVMGYKPRSAESVIEFTYRSPLAKWLTVQPDVQYLIHPGPARSADHALAAGLRFELGF